MKATTQQKHPERAAEPTVHFDEKLACDVCGRFGACQFGERKLCRECYEGCGSCCPEFGRDDLWRLREGL